MSVDVACGAASATSCGAQPRDVSVYLHMFSPASRTVPVLLSGSASGGEICRGVAQSLGLGAKDEPLLRLTTRGGRTISNDELLSDIAGPLRDLDLEVRVRVCGGKGGFGNMLRAQGGRMSQRAKEQSQDSCRDLNGRRLSTIKEAQRLAEYLEKEPERRAALSEAQAKKYAKLERMLGRQPKTTKDFEEAATKLDDAGEELEGPAPAPEASTSGTSGPKRKERIEDHEYVEQSREIVDNVRSAVASAMKKKNKKKRTAPVSKEQPTKEAPPV